MSILETIANLGKAPRAPNETIDILDRLHEEHELVKKLCKQLVESEKAPERTRLLNELKKALVPHERAEEKVVYDRIAALKDKEAKVDSAEGYLEHQLGDSVVAKLSKIADKKSVEFTAAAKVLKELLEHHIKEEEHAIWPIVRDNFSEDEREKMDVEFRAFKQKVKVP